MKSVIFSSRKDAQEMESLESLKTKLEQQLKDISAEKSDVIRESQVLKDQLQKSEKELTEARERVEVLEEMLRQNEDGKRYQDESSEDVARLRDIESRYEEIRREKEFLASENESLKLEAESLTHTIGELQNQLYVKSEIIDGQKGVIKRGEERIGELEKELSEREEGSDGQADEPESTQRIQELEKELRNNEILLRHYEDAEKNNILLNQDLQKARSFIKTLKKSISQLMEQMESQQKGIQYFAENIAKQQSDMKEKMQEMTEVQLKNVELEDSLSNMTDLCETLKKKNEMLLHENEALRQSVRSGSPGQSTNIITPEKFERMGGDIQPEDRASMALSRCEDAWSNARNLLSGIMEGGDIDDDVFGMMS